jgi:uroporphyrin-III C-methyltransferase / precorrin-2 dehydrogenase / sirohydrochlorin ferrochelatase
MRYFPIFLDLRGRRVLLVGGGDVAARKAALLRRAGAEIVAASRFDPADLPGCALAVAAGATDAEAEGLSVAARAAGIPVNVVDRPELCSCIMPAIVDRDPVAIAIGSGGAAPVLARLLRARIEAAVPSAFGRLAALADGFRTEIRRRLPDLAARRRLLEHVFTGRVADLVFAGREAEARAAFAAALDGAPPAGGLVALVGAGPGDADLMTLRGQRLLGEADVVLHDADVGAAVLDLARRDAERMLAPSGQHAVSLLMELGGGGKRVVWLAQDHPAAGPVAAALEAAGVTVEIVPGVAAG